MYSFESLWCVYYDYRHKVSWGETREFCDGIGGRMLALESRQKQDNVLGWHDTSAFTRYLSLCFVICSYFARFLLELFKAGNFFNYRPYV